MQPVNRSDAKARFWWCMKLQPVSIADAERLERLLLHECRKALVADSLTGVLIEYTEETMKDIL